VLAPCNAIDRHPWAWIARPLQFDEEEYLLGLLGEFLGVIGRADECCEHLHEVAGITLTRTQHGLEHAAYALAALPQAGGAVIEDLLAPCQSPETRQKLSEFVGQVQSFRRNPRIFPGYFSVCGDGHGFGYGKHVPLARRSSVDGRCFGWARRMS
jgi:hypothetical protein